MAPNANPVIVVVGEFGLVIVPVPLISVHVPVPIKAALPAIVAVVEHIFWSGPATATVGGTTTVIVTWLHEIGHGGLLIVH